MTRSLKPLLEAIDQIQSEHDLRSHIAPQMGTYFGATRSAFFFFDQLPLNDPKLQKLLDLGLSLEHNPIARYLVEHHAPAHEALVMSPKTWKMMCPRPDHWHVMAGPMINCGQLVGAVGCTREKSMGAFNAQDLADLSAICLHISVWVSTMRLRSQSVSGSDRVAGNTSPQKTAPLQHQPIQTELRWNRTADRLTARELQIAELVALGQTNAEIGKELWITENSVKQALKRMFRKLEVSSRAEMVAKLSATHRLPMMSEQPV
ncbi:MAG: helix-turn-helix transcriptional regulator [Leptolyngbya sp. BL-A-14]